MSFLLSPQSQNPAQLRGLLVLLITQAQIQAEAPVLRAAKLHRIAGTIRRLLRAIIMADVAVYQLRLKRDMLTNPAWRERVIAGLGGFSALAQWRQRLRSGKIENHMPRDAQQFLPKQPAPWQSNSDTQKTPVQAAKSGHATKGVNATQGVHAAHRNHAHPFRLAPMPRRYFGRAQPMPSWRPYTPKPVQSPFDAPIILTPQDLWPPRIPAATGNTGERAYGNNDDEAVSSQHTLPPPKPDPP